MNTILDVLKLRTVKLNYTSPAICPPQISGSGSSIFLEAVDPVTPPTGLRFGGECSKFLTWDSYPGLVCFSLFSALDPGDLEGPYELVAECVTPDSAVVTSQGWWSFTTTDSEGHESLPSDPVRSGGTRPVTILLPTLGDIVSYTLYKNPDSLNPGGPSYPVITFGQTTVIEVRSTSGCYKVQAITADGVSPLSAPVCFDSEEGCCPPRPCVENRIWNYSLCSCETDTFIDITGPDTTGCVGEPYSSDLIAVGADGPCTWELVSGSIAPGLTFNGGTLVGNTMTIDGTPTSGGSFTYEVKCTDFVGTAITRTFNMTCLGVAEYGAMPATATDTAYGTSLTATGGVPLYSYAVTSGALPSGITLALSGDFAGSTPYPGTFYFGVTVTDGNGTQCETPLSIEVTDCPTPASYPSEAILDANPTLYGAMDYVRRVLWIPRMEWSPAPPHQTIHLFDTHTKAFLPDATDPSNLIDTAAKGDLSNGIGKAAIDTNNNLCVVFGQQGGVCSYDLDTKECVNVFKIPAISDPAASYWRQNVFDATRSYFYYTTSSTGSPLVVRAINWMGIVADYASGTGRTGSDNAYCPDTDTIYFRAGEGSGRFHKWNAASTLFAYNQGPGYGADNAVNLRYIRGVKLIMVATSNAGIRFYDPLNGDVLVGTAAINLSQVGQVDYNDCDGLICISTISGPAGIVVVNPATGFSHVTLDPFTGNYYSCFYDKYAGMLFGNHHTAKRIYTY